MMEGLKHLEVALAVVLVAFVGVAAYMICWMADSINALLEMPYIDGLVMVLVVLIVMCMVCMVVVMVVASLTLRDVLALVVGDGED